MKKRLLYFYFCLVSLVAIAFQSCGVGASIELAQHIDSLTKNYSAEKPKYKIFSADTNKMFTRYNYLKNTYSQQLDSIREAMEALAPEQRDKIVWPVRPDSSLFLDVLFVDKSAWPDSITLGLKVYNDKGETITGLAPPYISLNHAKKRYWRPVLESPESDLCAKSQVEIPDFKIHEIRKNSAANQAITYLLDYSGSMGGNIEIFEKLIKKMVISSRKGDYYSFIPFAGRPYVAQRLTSNLNSVKTLFDNDDFRDSINNGTAISASIEAAVIEVSKASDTLTKSIVLLTDGFEGISGYKLESLLEKARSNNIKIYPIAFGYNNNISNLKLYAEATGGRFYNITNSREFKFAFADIYLDLSAYYQLSYKPNGCRGFTNITANLELQALDGMNLQANGAYNNSFLPQADKKLIVKYVDIIFPTGSSRISDDSKHLIQQIATELLEAAKSKSNITITVIGHTDNVGSEENNLELSEKRALSVMTALIAGGVPKQYIESKGVGEADPSASNSTSHGRAKNRRTELKIEME